MTRDITPSCLTVAFSGQSLGGILLILLHLPMNLCNEKGRMNG